MKQYLLLACSIISINTFAQKDKSAAILKKGQELTIIDSGKMEMTMMMPMVNTSTITTYKVKVIDVDAKNYTVTNTITKLVVNGTMMGQPTAFDSDKSEDKTSESGSGYAAILEKVDTILIDIKTGAGKSINPERVPDFNPGDGLQDMMTGAAVNSGPGTAASIFFVAPVELKTGSTWTDSSTNEGIKTTTIYKVENIAKGMATISANGVIEGSTSMEAQGQSMDMKMKTVSKGTFLVDTRTNLVKKRSASAEIDGSMDMSGQSMPFTSKTGAEISYQ
jgi:hypothetical protein